MNIGNVDSLEMLKATSLKAKTNNKKEQIFSEKKENQFEKFMHSKIEKAENKVSVKSENNTQAAKENSSSDLEYKSPSIAEEDTSKDAEVEASSQTVVDISLLMKLLTMLKQSGQEEITADNLKQLIGSTDTKAMNSLASLLNTLTDNINNSGTNTDVNNISSDLLKMLVEEESASILSKDLISDINALVQEAVKEPVSVEDKLRALLKNSNLENLDETYDELQDSSNLTSLVETKTETSKVQSNSNLTNENSFDDGDTKEDKLLKSIINSDTKAENKFMAISNHLNRIADANVPVNEISEALTVNKNNMVNDVVKVVKYMDLNNLKELTVKLNPKDLGEISIKLTMEGNLLKANISASNKETYSLLNSNLLDLKNNLNNQQIKIQEVAINLYNEDTTFFSNNFNNNGQQFSGNRQGETRTERVTRLNEAEEIELETVTTDTDNNLSVLA